MGNQDPSACQTWVVLKSNKTQCMKGKLLVGLLFIAGYVLAQEAPSPGLKGRIKKRTEYRADINGGRTISNVDEYNSGNLVRRHSVYAGKILEMVCDYRYDSAGRMTNLTCVKKGKGIDSEYTWEYDKQGKLLRKIEDNKDDTAYNSVFIYSYDEQGRKTRSDERTLTNQYKAHGEYSYKGDSVLYKHFSNGQLDDAKIRVYDSKGREVQLIVKPDFNLPYVIMRYESTYNDEGREVKKVAFDNDGFLHQFEYTYNPGGYLIRMVFNNKTETEITTYEYLFDKTGNIVKEVTRADGKIKYIHEYEYEYFD